MPKTTKHLKKHQFKKGKPSANPEGGRLHNPAIRALSKLTVETYREVIQIVLTGTLADLKAMAENPNTSALQVGIATAFMKAIQSGDYTVIERIAERIVGKIPDELKVTSNNINATLSAAVDMDELKRAYKKIRSDVE